jgi:ubiquinone/menaquinone biosynthesis C-methylase UbiE
MKVPRSFSVKVQYILDQFVPPIIRDSRWFMYIPMRFILKDATQDFMTFKDWVFTRSDEEYSALYERTGHVQELQGDTDLNQACLDEILRLTNGKRVLEVGCGRGFLANKLATHNKVTGCDIVISQKVKRRYPKVKFVEANIEALPFKDQSFDIVVCTHTLEHVKNLGLSVSELRRVTKEELIIVVPKQRPYKYTFSLHTQFFPYTWSLQAALGFNPKTTTLRQLGGDWFYHQKMSGTPTK